MSESAPLGVSSGVPDGVSAAAAVPATSSADEAALLELLGVSAYIRLGQFALVARHAVGAPDLTAAQRLLVVATRAGASQQELIELARSRGADPVALMSPYSGILSAFEARTQESLWWEGVVKAVVGHGVCADLCSVLAHGLPQADDAAVNAALVPPDRDQDLRVTQMVAAAAAEDPKLASRLGLWGRRVVGESLELSQQLLVTRPVLGGLARAAADSAAAASGAQAPSDAIAWVINELTAEHARRMDRMGLPA